MQVTKVARAEQPAHRGSNTGARAAGAPHRYARPRKLRSDQALPAAVGQEAEEEQHRAGSGA